MLRALDLDHQPLFQADEVHYVGPDRKLAAELEPLKPAIAKLEPEPLFGQGRFGSQPLGKGVGLHGAYPELFDPIRYSHYPVAYGWAGSLSLTLALSQREREPIGESLKVKITRGL
ncbi:hypothetical protein D3C79_827350 [compost metagenome]